MNICIVSPRYPYKNNLEFVFVKKIVDEWAKLGHCCVVITEYSLSSYLRKKLDYRPRHYRDTVSSEIFVDVYNPRIITTKLKIRDFSLDNWFANYIYKNLLINLGINFDLIYCHFFNSSLKVFRFAKENRVPLFVSTGESSIPILTKPYHSFEWSDFRSYTTGIIAVSSKNKNEAAKMGLIDIKKCRVFPNGTDLNLFTQLDRTECRKKLGFYQDLFIISCVGYFCVRKGQNRILEAIRKLHKNNIRVLFIGNETKEDTFPLEGNEIIYKGIVKNEDLPTYLCASDLFCLPTRAEGCCNAIIEALACGLPIVSSNLPFNWDILNNENSILIDPNNIDEISTAICTLYSNSSLRQKMSNSASESAKKLSVQKRAIGILNFMKNEIDNNNN